MRDISSSIHNLGVWVIRELVEVRKILNPDINIIAGQTEKVFPKLTQM